MGVLRSLTHAVGTRDADERASLFTQARGSGVLRRSGLVHPLGARGGAASLTCASRRPMLGPADYPAAPPHERSTSSRRSRVRAVSTPWFPARDRRNRRAP